MPMRSASSISSSWRRNSSSCVEFWRGVVVDQMASRMPHLPGSPRRLAAALGAMLLASGHAVNPRRDLPPQREAERRGVTALCGGLRQALKASAIFHRRKPQSPLKPGDRAALVALAEVLEAGHFDDVGDVN